MKIQKTKDVSVKTRKSILIAIKTPDIENQECEYSLLELERLASTLEIEVIDKIVQRLPQTTGKSVVGEGKLEELKSYTIHSSDPIDVVIFDCELTPSQIRNVEDALGVQVYDRTSIIIEIFAKHAKTKEAQLQVELAKLNYLAPRIREKKKKGDRQHFSGRGAGESQLELEKRRIKDKRAMLRRELEELHQEFDSRRATRSHQANVVLVGYTNAGKSSAMRSLTGSNVLVQDKLFATLDTTVRALQPETTPRILISDTVGFIKKLPHDLVASFHSTLEEAKHASLLLYMVDAADITFRSQLQVLTEVLKEIGADSIPHFLIFNKSDRLNEEQKSQLLNEFPNAILNSTRKLKDVESLYNKIVDFFEKSMITENIVVPYNAQKVIGEIRNSTKVINEHCEGDGTHFCLKATQAEMMRIKKLLKVA